MTVSPVDYSKAYPNVRLDLYVSRNSVDSTIALDNLRLAFLEHSGEPLPEITIIDIHDSPLIAYREGIIVTPTLIVTIDGVANTMLGNLSDPETTRLLLARIL